MIQQQGCSGEDSGRCRLETVAHCSPPGCVGSYSQSIWQILVRKWDSEKGNRCSPYWYTLVYTLVCMLSSSVVTGSFVTPWTIALQASLPMVFSIQVYWSGLLFPPPGIPLTQEWTHVSYISCIGRWILYHWDTREPHTCSLGLLWGCLTQFRGVVVGRRWGSVHWEVF